MSKPEHKYPCDYVVKIIGVENLKFPKEVIDIIESETTLLEHKLTLSKNKKYRSLSVKLHLESEVQMEKIYQQIKTKPYIKMIL